MLGAVFGKLMENTGMARSVAVAMTRLIGTKRAILGVFISAAVLTYGGVSLFVVVFAVYPLALTLFKEANIPRRLIPGTVALGAFTFTMTANSRYTTNPKPYITYGIFSYNCNSSTNYGYRSCTNHGRWRVFLSSVA